MARLVTLAFLAACGCLAAGREGAVANETAPSVGEKRGQDVHGEVQADEGAGAAADAMGQDAEAGDEEEPKQTGLPEQDRDQEQRQRKEQADQARDQGQPQQKDQPEQGQDQGYMQKYLPPGDAKYSDSFVGKSASWRQYMDSSAASQADYVQYIKKNGGPQADYQRYVNLYSAMAGAHPTSGKDWQEDKTQQLAAWTSAMDATYQTYIPGSYQHFAEQSTRARAQPGNDYQQFMAAYGSSPRSTSGGKGGQGGADYQQYMDYQKYMQGGQGGAGDYKQYMDYQKYMQGGQGGAGDYKQYMDYQKYMQGGQGGQGAQADDNATTLVADAGSDKDPWGNTASSGYQQYMDYQKYTQGGAGDYKQYMDYQKYMQGGQGGQGGQGAGDYQQFMDYQKYTQGATGGDSGTTLVAALGGDTAVGDQTSKDSKAGSSHHQYKDYQKYMPGGQGGAGDYKQYMDYYTGYQKHPQAAAQRPAPEQCNTTEQLDAWRDAQLEQLGQWMPEAYQNYARAPIEQRYQKNLARLRGEKYEEPVAALLSAAECNTTEQLRQWRDQREADVKKYTPAAYRQYAVAPIQQEYEKQLARIKGEPAAELAPRSAADCKTEAQLEAWRERQESQMQYIPAAFRQNALGPLRREYEKNLARLRAAKSEVGRAGIGGANVTGASTSASSKGSDASTAKGERSDTEASAESTLQPPAEPTSAGDAGSKGDADASKAADGQMPAIADGAGSADDADSSRVHADNTTGSTASAASASGAGKASTTASASMDLAQDGSSLLGAPKVLLAVCAGLALLAIMAFASRACHEQPRAEEDGDTPFLLLSTVA